MTVPAFTANDLFTPSTAEELEAVALANAEILKLRTTAWQQGGVTRTVLAVVAQLLQSEDVAISLLNQGGFLDFAATGTVTYTDPSGNVVTAYVTPDPSDPAQNPEGALGALDVLADSVYDVQRILATSAGGAMAVANTSGSTYGPFTLGTYHVAQPTAPGSPTYSNTATVSIPPSVTVGTVTAATNATPIAITTAAPHGILTGETVFIIGVTGNTNANGPWVITKTGANTFTLDGSAGNSNYVSGGTVYTPTVANFTADAPGTPSNASERNKITQPVTSLVGVSVGNLVPFIGSDTQTNVELAATCRLKLQSLSPNGPQGAYEYFALRSQILAPRLTPPLAVAAAITRVLVDPDPLTCTVITTIANSQGAPSVSDLATVDAVLQAYCVPLGVTSITQTPDEHDVAAVATLFVQAAYSSAAVAVAALALQVFFRVLPIGGVTDPGGSAPSTNMVPFDACLGAIFAACKVNKIPLQDAALTLNGGTSNIQLVISPVPEVAVLSPDPPTVTAVPV